MRLKVGKNLSYANVMSTLATFIAIGGSAYAGVALPSNSVGNRQLKDGAVSLAKILPSTRQALEGVSTGGLPTLYQHTTLGGDTQETSSVSVPAGDYFLVGTGNIYDSQFYESNSVSCVYSSTSGTLAFQSHENNTMDTIDQRAIPVVSSISLPSAGTISLTCSGPDVENVKLSALRVAHQ